MKKIVLGGGCFWCIEAVYQQVKGIEHVVSGFAGGKAGTTPDYQSIHYNDDGHAEVVELTYDEAVIDLPTILEIFFGSHDPTTTQQPGTADSGPEYRSIVLCDADELDIVHAAKETAQENWDKPIITEIAVLDKFHPAGKEHQNFYNDNPGVGYCQVIINPKLDKLRKNFEQYLK